MTDAIFNVGLLVTFFALFYWLFRKPVTDDGAKPEYLTSHKDLGHAGKYLRKHKPAGNTNTLVNGVMGAPRTFYYASATLTQDKKFPDVSFYQGAIDWDIMRQKTDAVIIRAGQNTWIDAQFIRNWKEAKRVGIRRGIYWFYDDRVSPGDQAGILCGLPLDDLPELEIFIDWENSYGGSYQGLNNVVAMMQAVEQALPTCTVGLYTGYFWFREHSNALRNILQYNYLKNKPLWLAWYADAAIVQVPQPWSRITHWQYGTPSVGEEWGVQTFELDMNYFNGSETDFALRYGGLLPGEPGPGETMDRYRATWDDGCNRRPAPNINNSPVPPAIIDNAEFDIFGYFVPDGKTEAQERWGRMSDGKWVALVYNSQVRAVLTSVPPPPADAFPPEIGLTIGGVTKAYILK